MIEVVSTEKESLLDKARDDVNSSMNKASLLEFRRRAKNFTSDERAVVLRYATNKELVGEVLRRLDKLSNFVVSIRGLIKLNFGEKEDCDWSDELDSVINDLRVSTYE